MSTTDQDRPTEYLDATARHFVLWCLEALGRSVIQQSIGSYEIGCSESTRKNPIDSEEPVDGLRNRRFVFHPDDLLGSGSERVEVVTFESPLWEWLRNQLGTRGRPLHASPAAQSTSVHELAQRLFSSYQIDGGHVHLAGCSLQERPFLRLTFLHRDSEGGAHSQIVHCFAASDGRLIDAETLQRLGLDDVVPLTRHTPRLDEAVFRDWVVVARRQCSSACDARNEGSLVAVTLAWCKHADGKLAFTIGKYSVELSFSQWAQLLSDGTEPPPLFTCPWTGRQSYHLAATDDGRITVADVIRTCRQSGRRVLETELERCDISGQRVLPEYLTTCPVTGDRILRSLVVSCSMCGQSVSPRAIVDECCAACRQPVQVSKDAPPIARVLGTFPKLDRIRKWRFAETETIYILIGTSLWKRLLLVLDKQTLDVLRLAASTRIDSAWSELTATQRDEWLG